MDAVDGVSGAVVRGLHLPIPQAATGAFVPVGAQGIGHGQHLSVMSDGRWLGFCTPLPCWAQSCGLATLPGGPRGRVFDGGSGRQVLLAPRWLLVVSQTVANRLAVLLSSDRVLACWCRHGMRRMGVR